MPIYFVSPNLRRCLCRGATLNAQAPGQKKALTSENLGCLKKLKNVYVTDRLPHLEQRLRPCRIVVGRAFD